jgi:3-phytase
MKHPLYYPSAFILMLLLVLSCSHGKEQPGALTESSRIAEIIRPDIITDTVKHDSDDPAIWINQKDPSQSLVIGTDKGGDTGDGAVYVFDLNGKEIKEKTVHGINRPNNVDVAYDFRVKDKVLDIAVCTERNTNSIRVFSLPDMKVIDGGGIPVFETDTIRAPMGIALYTAPDGNIYAIVSRKTGASGSYLWQYKLSWSGNKAIGKVVRRFGNYSGKHEIEAIAVDNELGYVYYSDEGAGIRKYHAHPDSSNVELAFFGQYIFADNHEGISIYKSSQRSGYIVVSDQQADQFHIFRREGEPGNKHKHEVIKTVKASTVVSDGNDITSVSLPGFHRGMFVAMSDDKTFQFYRAESILPLDSEKEVSVK